LTLVLAELLRERAQAAKAGGKLSEPQSPWHLRDGWRLNADAKRTLIFRIGDVQKTLRIASRGEGFDIVLDGVSSSVNGSINPRGLLRAELDGIRITATVVVAGERRHVFAQGRTWQFAAVDPLHFVGVGGGAEGSLLAPMPGAVIALMAEEGEIVEKGTPLLILEAMKMEHTITAPARGTVKRFCFRVGDQVGDGAELVEFEVG
jgi:3-methylcrotonyl-CoA carboxylase alpha subunit